MQTGTNIKAYNLPICNVETQRRNFEGVGEAQYFTLVDIVNGDTAGTTETDSRTAPPVPGYTAINMKGGQRDRWPTKRS